VCGIPQIRRKIDYCRTRPEWAMRFKPRKALSRHCQSGDRKSPTLYLGGVRIALIYGLGLSAR
jgi:hypothetical protein